MSRNRRFFRPAMASVVAVATGVAYVGISVPVSPARAADSETTALLALLDDLDAFVPGLAAVGALGETIPTLGVSPGSPAGLGLADLMSLSRVVLDAAGLATATDVGDFVGAVDGANGPISGGRTVSFTASETTPGSITVTMAVSKDIASTALDIAGTEPIGPGYPPFSLTSSGGVALELDLSASFGFNYIPGGAGPAWLTTPNLSIAAAGTFATPLDVPGGLGILGIELGAGSTFALNATVMAAFEDPNNDGKLYFDEPGGGNDTDGELSAAGAGAGLVTASLTAGSVNANLNVVAAPSTFFSLPTATATVTVAGDLDAGTLDVTFASGAFDAIRGFLTLSTRDLAQGLASAATTVMGLQNATGVKLPFMRGDYGNAIGAVQAIANYLEATVPEPTSSSPLPGLPTFTSLQDLLEELDALTGADEVSIPVPTYDEVNHKVRFQIDIVRSTTVGAIDLNPLEDPVSGALATYTATTLTDDGGATFGPELIGRQVAAGTSSGVIASVAGNVLTLSPDPVTSDQNPTPTNFWNGGTPSNDSGYSIAAGDPKIGAVELGNALEADGSGAISNANAKFAQATVTPGFELHLPIVLDLVDPNVTDCDPGPGTAACPFSHTANGITQIIPALPLPADRIKLNVDGFGLTADADISTAVDIDATVGFLGVKVKGSLKACTVSGLVNAQCVGAKNAADHLLTLGLKPAADFAGEDAQGDISFSTLVTELTAALYANSPATVLDLAVAGQAYANLTVEVPGAPAFFGGTAPSASVEVFLPDITNPTVFTVTPGTNIGDLGSFNLDTSNPLALFGALLADLQALQGIIGDFPGSGALDNDIPLVGKSFNEVIGAGAAGSGAAVSYTDIAAVPAAPPAPAVPALTVLADTSKTFDKSYVGRTVRVGSQESRVFGFDPGNADQLVLKPALVPAPAAGTGYTSDSELQGLINTLQEASSPNLQAMLATLAEKLGVGSGATFEVLPGAGPAPDTLKLKLDWKRSYVNQAPMDLKFQFPSGTDRSLIGAQGSGIVTTTASGEVKVSLLIPLDPATLANPAAALMVDPTESSVKAGVTVNGDGIRFAANLGPFKATLGNALPAAAGTELRAGVGVSLTSDATAPQTLSAFAGGLTSGVTGAGAECAGVSSTVDLALCAKFPLFINGATTGSTPETSNIVVRLPLDTGSLTNTLNPLGAQVDGHDRIELPDNLSATLAAAALSLLSFGDGFAGYLEFAETALRTASFEGKLPLIGKDLQAGADFLGEVRTELEPIFAAAPTDTTAGAIRTFARNQLKDALPTTGPQFTIDVTCANPMQSATTPGVTKHGTGSGTSYEYKVAAYTTVDGALVYTAASPASAAIDHAATLTTTEYVAVTWAVVNGATGYVVLRSVGGGAYYQIHDAGNTLAFDDKGAANAPAPYVDVPAGPGPCPDDTPANEVTGFTIEVSIGQGKPTLKGCVNDASLPGTENDNCLTADIPLDLGIPGLSIKTTDTTAPIQAKVGWRLDLKLAFDRTAGFYVDTQEGQDPEFIVGAELDVPDLDAQLAFLNIRETNNDTATPEFLGTFSVDLHDSDGKLALDQILSPDVTDFVTATLNANVDIDWHLAATVGSGAALPGISTDFALTWGWSNIDPSTLGNLNIAFNNVKLDAGEFLGEVIRPIVEQVVKVFKPVQPVIDTLFERVPVLSDLAEAVGGDPITIATLAQTFSTLAGGPDLQPFLDVLKNIRDLLKALDGDCAPDPSPCLDVGDFELVSSKAIAQDANPATAKSLINEAAPSYNKNVNLLDHVNGKSSAPINQNGADADHEGFSFPFLEKPESIFGLLVGQDVDLVKFDSGPLTLGFEFQQSFGPVYAPPPVNIVVGGGASVTLRIVAGFDTYGIRTAIEKGKVDAGVLDSLFFYTTDDAGKPIPVVQFEGYLQAGASISLVVIEVGVVGGVKLTISFYWNDPNNDGKFRFSEFLAAALTNPICLFTVGGELSLFIKVFITLGISPFSVTFDFELVNVVILEFNLKPDCTPPPPKLGGVNGDTLYLFAGKFGGHEIRAPGYGSDYPFDNDGGAAEEKWVIRQHKAVPAMAAVADPDGAGPILAQSAKSAEPAKIVVTALGISEEFPDPGGNTIQHVVLDGDPVDTGKLAVTFNGGDKDTPFSKNVVVRTGTGADNVRTGIGGAVVDAGGGADQITTLERTNLALDPATAPTALVSGGPGADSITVGNGRDTVMGDKALSFATGATLSVTTADDPNTNGNESISVSLPTPLAPTGHSAPDPAGGNVTGGDIDQIAAGLGGSKIYGNNGADRIGTANDNPQADKVPAPANVERYRAGANRIVGGSGGDSIKSGSAGDTIFTGFEEVIGEDGVGSGDDAGIDENSVDTGTGTDTVYGSNAKDYVTTHSTTSQVATVFGGGANDVLIGALGEDKLYGGPANDYLVAGPATVSGNFPISDELSVLGGGFARQVVQEPIEGTPSEKLLVGGGGKDRIYGVDGPAKIYGDHTGVVCQRLSVPVSKEPVENPVVSPDPVADRDDNDLILGGEGVDTVNAGGGDDYVKLYGAADTACGSGGIDTMFGGDQSDLVYGGSGNDKLYGDNHSDEVFGNTGDDSIFGASGTDKLQGNAGSDFITGGLHSDLVIGGASKAGEPDAGDQLYGDAGDDTVIGDNADSESMPSYPQDLGSSNAAFAGTDYVYGGADNDLGYGGLEDDFVYGGTGNDDLEGNGGSDEVYGEVGTDNIIGGSSQVVSGTGLGSVGRPDVGDDLFGGTSDDVIAGDNAIVLRAGIAVTNTEITEGRTGVSPRGIQLLDLGYSPDLDNSGGDTISGGADPDVILGQDDEDLIHGDDGDDYTEGGQDNDTVYGDNGEDDLVGGGHVVQAGVGQGRDGQLDSGDTVYGGDAGDIALGDNGQILRNQVAKSDITENRGITPRTIEIYDLVTAGPEANTSGADWLHGQDEADVLLGQSGTDRITGGAAQDYAEGGPDADWVEGNAGRDDLLGGSSTTVDTTIGRAAVGQPDAFDVVWGQEGDDLVIGDNAVVSRVDDPHELTVRIGTDDLTGALTGSLTDGRAIQLLDLGGEIDSAGTLVTPSGGTFGADWLAGQNGVDVVLGQDGADKISGGSADDYAEGQGAGDAMLGDDDLVGVPVDPVPATAANEWPGSATAGYAADAGVDGQDELIGGKSEVGFRDGDDVIRSNGESDFVLGDNGTAVRDTEGLAGALVDRAYALRYAASAPGNAKIREADSDTPSTRFCNAALSLCERGGASGADLIYGDGGDDFLYGQDGADQIWGGGQDDDIYGELGDDRLFDEAGDDAILGDRGGIRDRYETGAGVFNLSVTQVPKVSYQGFSAGSVTRITDLLHDVNGDVFVGAGAGAKMPHNGMEEGGDDRSRGGLDDDSIHAGFGDDLANGDSGGDAVFGDDGADLLWGGKGCDQNVDTTATKPACFPGGVFDPAPHLPGGETVPAVTDYVLGGKGGTSAASLAGSSGSDLLDWRPRGSYSSPGTNSTCTDSLWPLDLAPVGKKGTSTTIDPCSWFLMTDITPAFTAAQYQHHQGVDWQYGGWGRDVLQGDEADNGPNEGDRLLDWNGAYNLYTHCNAAYGGFNDVRQHSPAWQSFLQRWEFGLGAGQAQSDATTNGTSAFVELALVYPGVDNAQGSGQAYPATPGHFDNPNACAP